MITMKNTMDFCKRLYSQRKKDVICVGIVAALCIGLGINGWFTYRAAAAVDYDKTLASSTALESHVLVGGDVYWGRNMNKWSQESPLKQAYPFSRLNEFERDKYDAWIINLECPSVPGVTQAPDFVPKLWQFNCDTSYLKEAAKWFDIVSLANNHIANQGHEVGQATTRTTLDQYGIQHFGGFNPHKSSDICEVVGLPARVRLDGKQQEVKLPIAMCGYHGVYYTITDKAVAEMEQYAKYMPVIAMPHMGREYQASVDDKRRDLYHRMIDHGADAVLGNHPHWVQPTESYKGKLIAYSMGNFIFDQQFSPEVSRSAAFDITLTLPENAVSADHLKAWVAIGNSCATSNDTCMADIRGQQLPRLPLKFHYNVVGVDTSGQITHKANQRLKDAILTRLDWQTTSQQLAQ